MGLACVNSTLADALPKCVAALGVVFVVFVYEMGGGRGPVHEQAPVHECLFMVCLRAGLWGSAHERLFIGLFTGLFLEQETLKYIRKH